MIQCANIGKSTLKALTEKYGISESTLKTIIHKYWIQNGTEDFFPSDIYINAELGKGQYLETSDAVREVWEKHYSKPQILESKELKEEKETAFKYFPESAVQVYEDNNGKYVLVVKKPVKELSNSIKVLSDGSTYSTQDYADYKLVTGKNAEEEPVESKSKPQTFTFEDGTTVQAPFRLNYQQEGALNAMDEFVKSNRNVMTLSGYAGTGKTSIMEMLAQKMKKQHKNIVFSASTNKAAAVLRDRVKKAGFTAQTLNKVFGISVEVDESKPYDASNLVVKLKNANITSGTVVVIDEASMINEENYKIINDIAKQFGLKIIYVGDEAQLAPVKESKISKVFRDSMNDIRRLTIVERTEDNAILKEATAIRNGEALSGESSFNAEGKGVAYVKPTNKETIKSIVDKFVPQLKKNPDYFRILAYTNNAVARYNDAVRNKLGYTDNTPRVGEPIVGYSNWGYLAGKGSDAAYRFINSESYTITKVGKTDTVHITLEDGTNIPMQATEVTISDAMGNEDTIKLMDIRHNEANRQNAIILAKEKARYWSMANRVGGQAAIAYRRKANKIDEFLFVNDVITDPTRKDKNGNPVRLQNKVFDFGYAMTAHKSQGSTFTHVLIDDVDIQTAKNRRSMDFGNMVPLDDISNMTTPDMSADMMSNEEEVDLEGTLFSEPTSTPKTISANIRQQLEYVVVSRATDTVTIISNNVKTEDSPLNHLEEKTINPEEPRSIKSTVNITQNASGRLGTLDKKDEKAYQEAKKVLRNSEATSQQHQKAEQTLADIYNKKKAEMQNIFDEIAKVANVKMSLEDAGGTWVGGEEYSFKVTIEATTQEDYDKALQAFSYVAEAARQDAFIENLGKVDDGEVTADSLLSKEHTPYIHIPFTKSLSTKEIAIVQGVFNKANTEELPLDATVTKDELSFAFPTWKLGDKPTKESYKKFYTKWLNKILEIYKNEKGRELKGLVGENHRRTYERSRVHQADNAFSEGESERNYSNQRRHYLSERGISQESNRKLSEQQGQEIKAATEKLLLQAAVPSTSVEGKTPFVPHPLQMTNLAKETGEAIIQVDKEWKENELFGLDKALAEVPEDLKHNIIDRIDQIKNAVDRVPLPNYEFMNDLHEDTLVDAEWKIPMLQDLDNQITKLLSSDNYKQGEEDTILEQMDRILEAADEEDLYGSLTKKQAEVVQQKLGSIGELNQKINNLYESNLIPASEVLHIAELIMNSITDDVTRLQKEPGLAKQWFPSLSTELDFQNASRKEIIETVGINRLIQAAKKNFDSSEHEYDDIETELQADLITDNWDAIVSFGTKIFAMNEGFGIKMDYKNGGYVLANGMKLGFDDLNEQQDIDSIREQVGDDQEHWQIEQRTLDILNTASEIVRMAIHECYKIGKDGKPVISKWGIKERINPREAINSILSWTQGALTIDDMVSKLMEKQIQHPWLTQLVDKLKVVEGQENPNADFQSQFFNTMCRSHQSYSIVLLDNGKYAAVPVNDHPSLTEITQSISAQFKMKQHPLFLTKGKELINLELLGNESMANAEEFNLHKGMKELRDIFGMSHDTEIGRADKKKTLSVPIFNKDTALNRLEEKPLSQEETQRAIDILSSAFKILGFAPSEEIMQEAATPENIVEMASKLRFLINDLDEARQGQLEGKSYDPFKFMGKNSVMGTLKNMLAPVTDVMDTVIPNVVYDDGKLYQAYVTPSYLTLLFEKFHWEDAKFKEFIEKEYGYSEWFKYPNSNDEGWRGGWLKQLATDKASRDLFAHTVELNFNKRRYMRNMTDAEYTVSLFTHYFAEDAEGKDTKVPAWFRVPIQSNKPSSEFIRFWSYRGGSYKESIVSGMYDMFLQEINRIQTVRMRNLTKDRPGFIKSFDENGRKFCFLPYLNEYFSDGKKENRTLLKDKDGISAEKRNEKLANYLQKIEKLSTVENDSEMRALVMDAIQSYMQQRADEILSDYEKKGLIEAAKSIKGIYPESLKKKEEQTEWVKNQLENFIWNDYYATNNILQLTIGDKAASKDADEMQKRLAQLHAPGIRANIKATDYEGNRVSDGVYRTIILKDFEMLKSNIIENLAEYFDREIEKATADQKEAWKAIKEDLVGENGRFRKINVVDGQGYSSPSSYRKKALMFGKWSKQAEKVYQNLKNGDFTMEDIQTAFQPLKPFVYSQLHKDMGITNAPIKSMPIPFQAKNSEYLLIMADALLQGQQTGRPNMLRAIYRIMEDSELLNPTKGIDTVQFESAIKSGLQGAVDINQFMYEEGGEEKAYAYLTHLMYKKDADGNQTREYDTQNFVQEASYEGYCLQQEVPEHFKNHNQAHGSQERMIIPSDLVAAINGETVYYEWTDPDGTKRKATAEEFGQEYENTIAQNIDSSIKQLKEELKLTSGNKKERNLALSEILQKEILDSSRYGIDMFLACGLDPETGDFRVPLGDPIQAKRIEQLLNSIIKNRVNKQEIAGGPIVQVTNWGTSKQLHIRFKDKQGNLLKTKEEWSKLHASSSDSSEGYKQYIKENQAGIAYFEVYAPAWSRDILKKFMDKDGNIDIGAIEILNPDLLKMISYRIPTEEKYSIAPMKVVGFMPERAGSAIMFPYELTEIDDSDFDVDKRYVMRKVIEIGTRYEVKEDENATEAEKSYVKHNQKSITNYLQKAVNLQANTTAEERAKIEKEVESIAEVDRRTAERAHQERLDTIERRNALIEDAEAKAEFSKNEEKNFDIWDKRAEKQENRYNKAIEKENDRYQTELDRINDRKNDTILKEIDKLENQKIKEKISQFLTIDRWNNSSQDDALTRQLRIAYLRYMYPTYEDTTGKIANDNKIIDMSWGVLTHEAIATQLLNPGGFDNFKKIGYQIAAFKNPNNTKSWEELGRMSVSELQDLHHSAKDLAWIDTQVEYYRQNAAAASLIGIFAVNKIAHAMLERDHLQINVEEFCGKEPFEIAGKEFNGLIDVDPTFDDTGKRIGKTIGSGVSASADAAKTPALHLMNVNLSTVNIFTTLLRLGIPEEIAGIFCSQNIISEILDEFNRKNLNNYEPMANIIEKRLIELRKQESIADNSNINMEGLSREELIEGLKDTEHPETDYKILFAFQKVRSLADAMRKPTFATRFNSISSAVGPQIIDNLILEHKMEQFGQNGDETGFYDKEGNPVTINDIFDMHPVLRAFAEAVNIARNLFIEMPAGSRSFRNLLTKLPGSLADTIYNDKKLLSDLSNFYQSYLLIREGMVDESKLQDYIEKFPKEFMTKDNEGKSIQDKYPNNALIQNIKLISSKKTGRSFLTIKLTGEDETTKDIYRTAWIDLHKKNPELSQKLFNYFFFRAGIGFSPKTGMALVPTFVKERLATKNAKGEEITYSDVYRKLPALSRVLKDQFDSELDEALMVIDQFIRNNWNESKLVPKKGGEGTNYKIDLNEGRLIAFTESDVADLVGVEYMRTYQNGQTYLWRLIGNEEDKENQEHRIYRRIKPLGDNNEYLEMSTKDIVKPYSETTLDIEDTDTSELQSKSPSESSAEQQAPTVPSKSQITLTMELVEEAIAAQWEANNIVKSKEEVKKRALDIKGKEKQNAKFMINALNKLGIQLTEEDFIKEFKKLC